MKNLFKALASFQSEVPTIHKATKGYGYSYADLPTIFNIINPLLEKHDLGITQLLNSDDRGNYINTVVFHTESGESIESNTYIPDVALKGMNQYQGFGSGVTYYRRYALSCALRLVTDVDNDGSGVQVAKKSPKNTYAHVETVVSDKKTMTSAQFEKCLKAISNGTYTVERLHNEFMLTDIQANALKVAKI